MNVMGFLPPVKPYRLLDVGCGEGRNAIFFARNGYDVSAFDISTVGVEKAREWALETNQKMDIFVEDFLQYRLSRNFDIIFSTGVFHYLPQNMRNEIIWNYKEHTFPGGINAISLFVYKPFIADAPDKAPNTYKWFSGELMTYYQDWIIEYSAEEIIDCNSGGVPHQHAIDRLVARKPS